jgi:molybdate transport system ATP-binding protein
MLHVAVKKRRGDFQLNASFTMPSAGIVALFGRSGCGKSTLVNVIAGLLDADEGVLSLNDITLFDRGGGVNVPAEKRRIGYVFQDARLFPHLSVSGNLNYARRRARGHVLIDFDQVIALLGLSTLLTRRTQQLSGGEKQRVAIARALLSQPALLLLDEPLASLDASRRAEVLPYLESVRDQLAIPMVYVSHDFDEVWRLATHVVLMDHGQTLAEGDLAAMSLNPGVRAIVGAEAVGAVVDGTVLDEAARGGLRPVGVGNGTLWIETSAAPGTGLRVHLLARDLIIATQAPQFLSVRNSLRGTVISIAEDDADSDLIGLDIGGAEIVARITRAATRDLKLAPGTTAWALVKSVSLRGYFARVPT